MADDDAADRVGVGSIAVAWGWPLWDAEASLLGKSIHHAQHPSVQAEFGYMHEDAVVLGPRGETARYFAAEFGEAAGLAATGIVLVAIIFASLVYWKRYQVLDPAEAKEQFPRIYALLEHKWYFDELYSAILVRPALVVAHAVRWFDTHVIDNIVNGFAKLGVLTVALDGIIDARIVDGLVNLLAGVCYGIGGAAAPRADGIFAELCSVLALAAVAIFILLSYFVTCAWRDNSAACGVATPCYAASGFPRRVSFHARNRPHLDVAVDLHPDAFSRSGCCCSPRAPKRECVGGRCSARR